MPVELADRIDAIDDLDVFMHDFVKDDEVSLANVTNVKNTRIRKFNINLFIIHFCSTVITSCFLCERKRRELVKIFHIMHVCLVEGGIGFSKSQWHFRIQLSFLAARRVRADVVVVLFTWFRRSCQQGLGRLSNWSLAIVGRWGLSELCQQVPSRLDNFWVWLIDNKWYLHIVLIVTSLPIGQEHKAFTFVKFLGILSIGWNCSYCLQISQTSICRLIVELFVNFWVVQSPSLRLWRSHWWIIQSYTAYTQACIDWTNTRQITVFRITTLVAAAVAANERWTQITVWCGWARDLDICFVGRRAVGAFLPRRRCTIKIFLRHLIGVESIFGRLLSSVRRE